MSALLIAATLAAAVLAARSFARGHPADCALCTALALAGALTLAAAP